MSTQTPHSQSPNTKESQSKVPRPTTIEQWWRTPCVVTAGVVVSGDLDRSSRERAARQLAKLIELGVTDIVDTRVEASDERYIRGLYPQVQYHHIGTDDDGYERDDEWFELGVQASLAAIRGGGTVLVHCHMGVNRGPSMAFAVLLALGWDPIAALEAIRTARPIAALVYAPDALKWWHRQTGVTGRDAEETCRAVEQWLEANPINTRLVISRIATAGGWA
jgi:hypothetical protein